jgi:hypothetical protein
MTMAYRPSDLQEAFFVPGTTSTARLAPRLAWDPGPTTEVGPVQRATKVGPERRALEEVLRPGYFVGTLLRPGEPIYVSARRGKRARGAVGDPGPGDVHMALLMVAKAAERGGARNAPSVRLVQDFGCPEGIPQPTMTAAAPLDAPPPVKRGRGRPPGSRNRKNGALPTLLVN